VRRIAIGLVVLLILTTAAIAYTTKAKTYTPIVVPEYTQGGYTGQWGRDRRAFDPYSRQQYFSADYQSPYWNYGKKGPTNMVVNTGMKSAYHTAFNLDRNSFIAQGRNPGKLSNWDPNVRGYTRYDKIVKLFSADGLIVNGGSVFPRGTARVVSYGDRYSTGIRKDWQKATRSQIWIQVRDVPPAPDVPPVGVDKLYEAWLKDYESGYMLSLGFLESGAKNTLQMYHEFNRVITSFDEVVITLEDYPDVNPGPSGRVITSGAINPERDLIATPSSYFGRLR